MPPRSVARPLGLIRPMLPVCQQAFTQAPLVMVRHLPNLQPQTMPHQTLQGHPLLQQRPRSHPLQSTTSWQRQPSPPPKTGTIPKQTAATAAPSAADELLQLIGNKRKAIRNEKKEEAAGKRAAIAAQEQAHAAERRAFLYGPVTAPAEADKRFSLVTRW